MGAPEGRKIAANPMAVMVSPEKARYLKEIGSVFRELYRAVSLTHTVEVNILSKQLTEILQSFPALLALLNFCFVLFLLGSKD